MAVAIVIKRRFDRQVVLFDDETAARAYLALNRGLRHGMLRKNGETGDIAFLPVDESNVTP